MRPYIHNQRKTTRTEAHSLGSLTIGDDRLKFGAVGAPGVAVCRTPSYVRELKVPRSPSEGREGWDPHVITELPSHVRLEVLVVDLVLVHANRPESLRIADILR